MKLSNSELALERLSKVIQKTNHSYEECANSWQQLILGQKIPTITLDCLFKALEVNYPALNLRAVESLTEKLRPIYSQNPLSVAACITPLGKLRIQKTELKKRLKKQGVSYQAKLAEDTTHLLIGHRLKQKELDYLLAHQEDYTLMTESLFLDYWSNTEDSYLLGESLEAAQLLQLKDLLWHDDPTNINLALGMLESGGLPSALLTTVFLIYKFHKDNDIVKRADRLLKIYGSADLILLLRKLKKEWWSAEYEQWVKKAALKSWEIYQYEYLKQGLKLSTFQKAMNESPKEEQIRFLQKAMEAWSWGEELDRMQLPADFDLETHADLVYSCTHLRQLEIQPAYSNRMQALPKGISALQHLEELTIHTALKEFPLELRQLPKLKSLKINMASMGIPQGVFEKGFEALEQLEMTYYRYKRLPEGIAALQNLEVLAIPSGDLEELPAALRALPKLKELRIHNNKLRKLPDVLFLLNNLKKLDVSGYWMRWQEDEVKILRAALPDCDIQV